MRTTALTLGGVAAAALGSPMVVRAVFANTMYIGSLSDMVILTSRGPRSPFTVNLDEGGWGTGAAVRPGDQVFVMRDSLEVGELSVDLRKAKTYAGTERISLDPEDGISNIERGAIQSALSLRLLYDALDESEFALTRSEELKRLVAGVLVPFGANEASRMRAESAYEGLLGFGGGFTPAGDDFVAGLLYVYNCLGKVFRLSPIMISEACLSQKTVWVSAMFLKYAQRGDVDEELGAFLQAVGRGDVETLSRVILRLANRGHTSGLDVSLGMLLTLGALGDHVKGTSMLGKMLRNLGLR